MDCSIQIHILEVVVEVCTFQLDIQLSGSGIIVGDGDSCSSITVLPPLRELLTGIVDIRPLEQLLRVTEVVEDPAVRRLLRIDFSVVDDIHYYNGIVFKGFVAGLPESVLSGGQYDNLMRRLKRKAGAIGFAVYTDLLERLEKTTNDSDVDAVLLYDETTPLMAIKTQMDLLMKRGSSVLAQQCLPENITCRQILDLRSGEVKLLENHA